MKFKNSCFTLLIFLTVASCKDDDFLNKLVLDKIVYHENVDQVGQFTYYSNGRIHQYQFFFNNKQEQYTDYTYSNGRLSEKNYFSTYSGSDSYLQTQSQLFSYGSNDEVQKIYLESNSLNGSKTYSYTWNDGKVMKVEVDSRAGSPAESFYEMEYDATGNVIKRLFYVLSDEAYKLEYIVEYEYDNKINPLYDLGEPIDLLTSIPNNISPNNVVKSFQRMNEESEPYATAEMEYTYNEFDRPVTKKETNNLDGSISETTIKFYYKKI